MTPNPVKIAEGRTITDWGAIMRLARRASMLATEEQRKLKRISDPLDSSIMLYTDDPSAAAILFGEPDLAAICKTSAIEGVCIVGNSFPPAAREADRSGDMEMPRVAAMFFTAPGLKCPRCYIFRRPSGDAVCSACAADPRVEAFRARGKAGRSSRP